MAVLVPHLPLGDVRPTYNASCHGGLASHVPGTGVQMTQGGHRSRIAPVKADITMRLGPRSAGELRCELIRLGWTLCDVPEGIRPRVWNGIWHGKPTTLRNAEIGIVICMFDSPCRGVGLSEILPPPLTGEQVSRALQSQWPPLATTPNVRDMEVFDKT